MGHSLGNMLVSAAISDSAAQIDLYCCLDGALPAEALSLAEPTQTGMMNTAWAGYPVRLWAYDWHNRFPTSDSRSNLSWVGRFNTVPGRTTFFNFFSPGDQVLHMDSGPTPSILGVLEDSAITSLFNELNSLGLPVSSAPEGSFSWAYQEKLKGLTPDGVVGSSYGGWGFNPVSTASLTQRALNSGSSVNSQPQQSTAASASSQSDSLSDVSLRTVPFFQPGSPTHLVSSWISQGNGSSRLVSEPLIGLFATNDTGFAARNQSRLLADFVPAMTQAAGAVIATGVANNTNFEDFENSWPSERTVNAAFGTHWLHSDLKAVAYPYVYKAFDELVADENLKL